MPGPPTLPSGTDKGLHYLLYGGLGILIARGLAGGDFAAIGWRVAVAATILAALYGWTDEIHQRFVAGRTFEYWDIVADATGAACGAVAARLWGRMGHDL
jgi:VanZ family protein